MAEIVITRNLSPTTRKEDSPYRIKLDRVGENDTLIVKVTNQNGRIREFTFLPGSTKGKKSIHFRDFGNEIYWLSGIKPDSVVEVDVEAIQME